MAKFLSGIRRDIFLLMLAQVPAIAFQPATQKIFIEPRRPVAAAEAAGDVHPAHLRVETSLVLIPADVTTPNGSRVNNLRKENFQIFEDGVEQEISFFSMEDAPLSVGLLLDSSGSMRNKIRQTERAAVEFFKTADPQDEFFLVEFSDRPKLTVPFTRDTSTILKRIARSRPNGQTSLLDAVQMALAQIKTARNTRKVLVILSDGGDNRSRATIGQVRTAVLESDVQVYSMGIFDDGTRHRRTREEQNGPQLLEDLAERSGGKLYQAGTPDDLPGISARIGTELRNQYLIGYTPDALQSDGKYYRVKLRLAPAAEMSTLRVHYRPGYYAPAR